MLLVCTQTTQKYGQSLKIHSMTLTCTKQYQQGQRLLTRQDAQLSQREGAARCVIVFAKNRTLELGDNDLRTL